ncbi:IS66-like element ISRhru2 family transposase [soil metagenome]
MLDIQALIQTLLQKIEQLEARVKTLEAENALLKNKKNSNNSHIPPSQDQNRPRKNQSLRVSTDRKAGGQPGHEGTTLECRSKVDETIKHSPAVCDGCGSNLSSQPEKLVSTRQLIDIPTIVLKCIEHQVYKKQCSCGHTTVSDFPKHVANPVQYGPNVESLVGYLHARQYLPYARTKEFLNDVMGLSISTGGIHNILQRMAKKALPMYNTIKQKVVQATCIGADETGVNINGKNHWAWTWQNNTLTYIVCAASRGFKTIAAAFENGLPNAVLIHDRWPCHFQMNAKAHQICTAHLLRDLNYINELYKDKCIWATAFKALLQEAIQLKKELTTADYYYPNIKRDELFEKLNQWLPYSIDERHKMSKKLQKKLLAKREYILYFLLQSNVAPDNNGSERAIRNIKVKQKISGQFKTMETANMFAVLRSVIDTTIKNGNNVLNALHLIATFGTE